MRLGIVVTDEKHGDQALGLAQAAAMRGWFVRCFLTDTGVRLVDRPQFQACMQQEGVEMTLCEHSLAHYRSDLNPSDLSARVTIGGQYQDAELAHKSDRVLVF